MHNWHDGTFAPMYEINDRTSSGESSFDHTHGSGETRLIDTTDQN